MLFLDANAQNLYCPLYQYRYYCLCSNMATKPQRLRSPCLPIIMSLKPSIHKCKILPVARRCPCCNTKKNQRTRETMQRAMLNALVPNLTQNQSLCPYSLLYPTTAFMLRLSRKPPKSSFFTSTTQCSKLSILTRALVSATTSWNALPNRFNP